MSKDNKKLPDGWQWVKLGDVCEIIMGQSPPSSTYQTEPIGLPFFQGKADFGKVSPIPRVWCNQPKKIAQIGDILISIRAPVGPTNIADRECCVGRGLAIIRPQKKANRDLILWALKLYESKLVSLGSGSTFEAINRKDLETLEIPLPPIDEQKRIASILNEQMSAVEKARKATEAQLESALALPSAYLRSYFHSEEAKSWKQVKLGDVCTIQGGMQPPKSVFKYEPLEGYIRLVQIQDFRISNAKVYIPKDTAKRGFNETDVMIGRYGPPIFQILRGLSGAYNVALMKTIPESSKLDKDFLYYLLQEPIIQKAVKDQSQRTAGQSGVQKTFLENYIVKIPSLERQREISIELNEKMRECEKLKQALQEQLKTVNQLPSALLRRAFSGEL